MPTFRSSEHTGIAPSNPSDTQKRVNMRVAVRDTRPHRFQIVPLREARRFSISEEKRVTTDFVTKRKPVRPSTVGKAFLGPIPIPFTVTTTLQAQSSSQHFDSERNMNISRKCSSRASQSASVSHQSQENIDRPPLYDDSFSTRVSSDIDAFSLSDEFLAYLHRSSTGSARPPSSSSQSQSTAVEELLAYPRRSSQPSISSPSFCSHSKASNVHSDHEHIKRQALYTQSPYLTKASALVSEAPIPVPCLPTSTSCSTIASIYSQNSYEYTFPSPLVHSSFFSNNVMQECHTGYAFPDLVLGLMAEIDAEIAEWRCLGVVL